jgi:hypothetical protein
VNKKNVSDKISTTDLMLLHLMIRAYGEDCLIEILGEIKEKGGVEKVRWVLE